MAKKINVWLVDDDKINNLICRTLLNERSWLGNCTEFTESLPVFEIIDKGDSSDIPDVILLDINMPDKSGWDIVEVLNAKLTELEKEELPCIVLLTSSIDEEERQRAKAHPLVTGLISKPLNVESLESICGISTSIND